MPSPALSRLENPPSSPYSISGVAAPTSLPSPRSSLSLSQNSPTSPNSSLSHQRQKPSLTSIPQQHSEGNAGRRSMSSAANPNDPELAAATQMQAERDLVRAWAKERKELRDQGVTVPPLQPISSSDGTPINPLGEVDGEGNRKSSIGVLDNMAVPPLSSVGIGVTGSGIISREGSRRNSRSASAGVPSARGSMSSGVATGLGLGGVGSFSMTPAGSMGMSTISGGGGGVSRGRGSMSASAGARPKVVQEEEDSKKEDDEAIEDDDEHEQEQAVKANSRENETDTDKLVDGAGAKLEKIVDGVKVEEGPTTPRTAQPNGPVNRYPQTKASLDSTKPTNPSPLTGKKFVVLSSKDRDQNANQLTFIDPPKTVVDSAKRLASHLAVDNHIHSEHKVIGIGSGSTVPYVVERIIEKGGNEDRWFIPTGFQSKELIIRGGLKLGDVDSYPRIDVTIDGADEVDSDLNAIKGGGACHLREKVLAEAADEWILVADYRKKSSILGQAWKQGIPIEVPPFAYSKVLENITRMPGAMDPVLRMGKAKAGPVVTDNGNFVIDAVFDETHMREPEILLHKLKMLTGVLEVGLFCGMARACYFGNEDGTVTVKWSDGTIQQLDGNSTPQE